MNNSDLTAKSCDPQLLQSDPLKTWNVNELGKYAEAQHAEIETREKALAPVYWQLGKALNLARKNFAHGQWSGFLEQWGIDKTRASKAGAIHRTFKEPQQVENLSVQEAYNRRKRQPRKRSLASSTTAPQRREQKVGLGEWIIDVCQQADSYFDDAACAPPEQAASLMVAIDAAVDQLKCLRAQFKHGNQDSGDQDTIRLTEDDSDQCH